MEKKKKITTERKNIRNDYFPVPTDLQFYNMTASGDQTVRYRPVWGPDCYTATVYQCLLFFNIDFNSKKYAVVSPWE